MDTYFRSHLRIFPYINDGTKHVPNSGKVAPAYESFLRNQVGGYLRIPGPILFHFCCPNVFDKKNSGKTCVAGEIGAAKSKGLMSYEHSWFYPTSTGEPAG